MALKRQGLDPNQIGTGVRHPRVDASAALAEHGDQLACGRVVVTHMSSDMLAKMDQTPFDPASDGLELQV